MSEEDKGKNIPVKKEKEEKESKPLPIDMPTDEPTIDDLVGKSKEFADNIVESVNFGQMFYMLATSPDKTFVIDGPPGTGKTFSIQAINNTINKDVPKRMRGEKPLTGDPNNPYGIKMFVFGYDIGRYGTAYINMGSRTIQQFFDNIYQFAHKIPVMIKLDEADALLGSRKSGTQNHQEDKKVLETIMKNLQEAHDMENVYVVMLTNLVEDVDDAVLRAGRVDRRYTFELPNQYQREQLFYKIIQNKNEKAGYSVLRNYDIENLAKVTHGFNNADIAAVVEKSLREKAKKVIADKKPGIIPAAYVTQKGLKEQIKYHRREFKRDNKKRIGYV